MRTINALYNGIIGFSSKILMLILQFVVRMIFVKYLSKELLGYDGLFTNILGVLSLVDMGIGTALTFSLYKPIYEHDDELLSGIMNLYKRIYLVIGLIILFLSICLIPFLNIFIKDNLIEMVQIQKAFLIFSLSTVVTYFFSYKRTIIYAYQQNYIVIIVDTLCKIIMSIMQILVIIIYQNYLLYLLCILLGNFCSNVIISKICDSKKLYIKKENVKLPLSFKRDLYCKVKNLAITNICGVGITSTDNILISSLVGVIDLAKNSNYSMIIMAIQSLINNLLGGATASIGDLIAEGNENKINYYFNLFCFIYFAVGSFCSLCLYFLFDPFIGIWVGDDLIFDLNIKRVLIINFYLYMIQQPVWTFQNLAGLYNKYKIISIIEVIINLFFSILLGKIFGIVGIFIGTTMSYLFGWFFCTKILYKYLLNRKYKFYFKNQIKYCLYLILCYICINLLLDSVVNYNIITLLLYFIVVSSIYITLFIIFFRKNCYFIYYKKLGSSIIRRLFK